MEHNNGKDEEPKSSPTEDGVSSETLERGETLDKFTNKDSPFRRTKNQNLNEPNPPLLDYTKPSYPLNKKKPRREMEVGQFKKFMEIFTVLQVNISFCEAWEQMPVYAKFTKEILNGKCKLKDGESIALTEECSSIVQRKLPSKLTNLGKFTISLLYRFIKNWPSTL